MTEQLKTDRREFLKKGVALGVAAGSAAVFGKTDSLWAKEAEKSIPDLVAVKNGEPDALFKKAIELMGGMEQFVKKGQTVVVKPNLVVALKPEAAITTNPILVKTICESCYQAGAKKVYIFDNHAQWTANNSFEVYKVTGIEDAAKSSGAVLLPGNDFKYYKSVNIPGVSNKLGSTLVHEFILNSDVFINVPVLRPHEWVKMTGAMKNLMGVVYDRMEYHEKGLDECIADFCLFGKPTLNVMDAYRVRHHVISSSSIELKKTLLMSRDIVAVDAAGAKILGLTPEHVHYISHGHRMKIGNMNLKELKIATHVL